MKRILLLLLLTHTLGAMPPEVIFFDYGGVMAKVNRKPLLHFIADSLEIPYERVKREFARDTLYSKLEEPLSYWEGYGNRKLSENWIKSFQEKKREMVSPLAEMTELVEKLKATGTRVALLSNTKRERALFLESLGSYRPFQRVILSCDVGVKKPHPHIFSFALKTLQVDPKACLFIDDKERNVRAAEKQGIDGIVFRSTCELKRELLKRGISLY